MEIKLGSVKAAESYAAAMNEVAREGKWLASTKGFSVEECLSFMKYIASTDSVQVLYEDKGRVIGWCDITPALGIKTGQLGIGLIKEYRGKGGGGRLLDDALERAKGRFKKVVLYVRIDNTRAISLYLKRGFKPIKLYKRGRYKGVPAEVVKMIKKIE